MIRYYFNAIPVNTFACIDLPEPLTCYIGTILDRLCATLDADPSPFIDRISTATVHPSLQPKSGRHFPPLFLTAMDAQLNDDPPSPSDDPYNTGPVPTTASGPPPHSIGKTASRPMASQPELNPRSCEACSHLYIEQDAILIHAPDLPPPEGQMR